MKKPVIFAAIATALMATSCSQDAVLEQNSGEITFGISANNGSRAADVYCTNNLPSQFTVYAGFDNKLYIDGDLIKKDGISWTNAAGVRYWPKGGDVTFYGIQNNGGAWQWNGETTTAPVVKDFTVPAEVAEQLDLIYARKTQAHNEGAEAQKVAMNFRHALSQVVYRAKNINPNLYVEISGVEIVNIDSKGTYTLPIVDTDINYANHTQTEAVADNTAASRGSWESSTPANYAVSFDAVELEGDKNAAPVALTSANDAGKEFSSNALLLIPNTKNAWDSKNEAAKVTTGTYFKLSVSIWNVAGEKINKETDICLWDQTKEGCETIYIPVAVDWKEGKKYIYTFVFGEGNGGHVPDPDDPDPDPVLVPIDLTVTVDDFIPAGNSDVDVKKP